jgi:hypothetical protein
MVYSSSFNVFYINFLYISDFLYEKIYINLIYTF